MFSIFNDQINKRILVADKEGNIESRPYNSGFSSYLKSEEGLVASDNQKQQEMLTRMTVIVVMMMIQMIVQNKII